jgi:hypothetical protein
VIKFCNPFETFKIIYIDNIKFYPNKILTNSVILKKKLFDLKFICFKQKKPEEFLLPAFVIKLIYYLSRFTVQENGFTFSFHLLINCFVSL